MLQFQVGDNVLVKESDSPYLLCGVIKEMARTNCLVDLECEPEYNDTVIVDYEDLQLVKV